MELSRLVVSLEVVGRIGDEVIFKTSFPVSTGVAAPQSGGSSLSSVAPHVIAGGVITPKAIIVPKATSGEHPVRGSVENPAMAGQTELADYIMPIGKYRGKSFGQIGQKALGDWANYMSDLTDLKGKGLEALNAAKRYLS